MLGMENKEQAPQPKQMHGCLTAYLTMMLLTNLGTSIFYLSSLGSNLTQRLSPPLLVFMAIMCLLNFVFTIALFKWKKWGFFGIIGSTIIAFVVNLYIGIGAMSLLGLSGIPILYAVLNIGKERAGWHQLD